LVHDLLAAALRGTSHADTFRLLPFSRAGGIADLTPRGEWCGASCASQRSGSISGPAHRARVKDAVSLS